MLSRRFKMTHLSNHYASALCQRLNSKNHAMIFQCSLGRWNTSAGDPPPGTVANISTFPSPAPAPLCTVTNIYLLSPTLTPFDICPLLYIPFRCMPLGRRYYTLTATGADDDDNHEENENNQPTTTITTKKKKIPIHGVLVRGCLGYLSTHGADLLSSVGDLPRRILTCPFYISLILFR